MQLAFYAPLKPPAHPIPSGDRAMARALLAGLRQTGATVALASILRSRDGDGNAHTQSRIMAEADAEIARLIPQGRAAGWQAWVTYHNYYKAPDLIGPQVSKTLGIPYLLIESTRARKRLTGPWATFANHAEAASDAADVVFYLTQRDSETLHRDRPQGQKLIHLRPFLAQDSLPSRCWQDGPMLAVGMLRQGDKLASYQIIADTLALLPVGAWKLDIAGDGPAHADIAALMARFGGAVRFLGRLDARGMAQAYAHASLLLWPGVNEAFGLAYLEAQAAGLPVVAQDRPGVRDVLAPGDYPAPEAGAAALAQRVQDLLHSPDRLAALGQTAREHIAKHHLLPAATATLSKGLRHCGVGP